MGTVNIQHAEALRDAWLAHGHSATAMVVVETLNRACVDASPESRNAS